MRAGALLMVVLLALVLVVPTVAQEDSSTDSGDTVTTDMSTTDSGDVVAPDNSDQTPLSQPTLAPTLVPTVVPTPGPGAVLFSDNFDDLNAPNFPLTSTGPDQSQGYIDGQYQVINGKPSGGVSITVPRGPYSNSSIAIDARIFGGPDTRSVYVECRDTSPAKYSLEVSPVKQTFRLARFDATKNVTLASQTSTAIHLGDAVNRLELSCVGPTISASINGTPVASVQDATYTSGQTLFGLNGGGSTARFDNLVVTQQ